MKNFKSKKLFFIILLIGTAFFALSSVNIANLAEEDRLFFKEDREQKIDECKNVLEDSEKYGYCQAVNEREKNFDHLEVYDLKSRIVDEYIFKGMNVYYFIIIIVMGACIYITKYFKSGIIKNVNNRENYKKIKRELFMSSWKYALIVPIMLIICYIIVYVYTGTFTISPNDISSASLEESVFGNNLLIYYIFDLYNALLLCLLYTNICLLVCRKEHNYILSVIKSFIAIIGLELFLEIFVDGMLLAGVFKYYGGAFFNIIDIVSFRESFGFWKEFIFTTGITVLSFALVFLAYKDKEKLVIDCEKNEEKDK